jgi:transcriptional regulator GlxA family with amidase domain
VAQAVRFIRANCRRPLQAGDVLKGLAARRRELHDRFLRTLGCSVHQHIKKVRVAEIERMLLETGHSIGAIAEILGFPSSEHIALYFRSIKGMNPHAFRSQRQMAGQDR